MRLYPAHILRIYVRNKQDEGMTAAQVAKWLRELLHWDAINPDAFDDFGKERYQEVADYLSRLEQGE